MNMQWLYSPEMRVARMTGLLPECLHYWAERKYRYGEQTQYLMQLAENDQQRKAVAVVALCQLTEEQLEPLLYQLDKETLALLAYRHLLREQFQL